MNLKCQNDLHFGTKGVQRMSEFTEIEVLQACTIAVMQNIDNKSDQHCKIVANLILGDRVYKV